MLPWCEHSDLGIYFSFLSRFVTLIILFLCIFTWVPVSVAAITANPSVTWCYPQGLPPCPYPSPPLPPLLGHGTVSKQPFLGV